MKTYNCVVEDDSGHRYIISYRLYGLWNSWLESEEEAVPEWAEYIDGKTVLFEDYKLI